MVKFRQVRRCDGFMMTELINILGDLVAFPSVTPASAGCLEYIAQWAQKLGGESIWLQRNETSNLIISWGYGDKVFAFAGHVDVVPPGEFKQWHGANPFKLIIAKERLIGRGVADMKGAIAAFLLALKQFINLNLDAKDYRIVLLLTSDEEGSAQDGTKVIVEYLQQQGLRLNYCLVGEPSSVARLGDSIKIGRRGSLTGKLSVLGKQGHIAYPHLCLNPIHQAVPSLVELIRRTWDLGTEHFPATSFQVVNLNAGLGVSNIIPGTLEAEFNFRYNNLQDALKLQQQVEIILQQYNLNYNISWNNSAQPFLTKPGKLCQQAQAAIVQIMKIKPQFTTDGGTSDGRFLIAVSDEIIELGLINASIHQINEATTTHDLESLNAIYYNILCKVFNG
jgi:succinyl-diaminopimelate desuccinylase